MKTYPIKNTLLQAATSNAETKACKRVLFFLSQEEIQLFFPTLRCFNFFATAQPATDKQSDSLSQTITGQYNLTQTTEARTANKVLPKAGVTGFYDTFVLNQTLVFQINSSAEMPRLRQYPNR
jgi:hypothetical protein